MEMYLELPRNTYLQIKTDSKFPGRLGRKKIFISQIIC